MVCGIDIGSTNTKVVTLDASGVVRSRAQRPTVRREDDLSIDAVAQQALVEQLLLEACGADLSVAAACTAGVGEDGVPVRADMSPTGAALAWFDPRRGRVFSALRPQLAAAPGLGTNDDAARTVVGWAWARSQGHLQEATAWVALTDYPASAWTGRAVMSDTIAARTAAWDQQARSWVSSRVQRTLGDARLLPEVLPAGAVVGMLRSAQLESAGVLADDAVVVMGGHDHPLGGWAVDRVHPNAILDSMGTAEVVVAQARTHLQRSTSVDVAPGILTGGTSLLSVEEFTRNVEWASLDPDVARELIAIASGEREPDSFVDSNTFIAGNRGGGRPRYIVGAPAGAASRASAVLGALARLGAESLDTVAALMPADARVYVAGGWSRARGWLRIKERISSRQMLIVGEPEVAAVGAALLAAEALGWSIDATQALSAGGSTTAVRGQPSS